MNRRILLAMVTLALAACDGSAPIEPQAAATPLPPCNPTAAQARVMVAVIDTAVNPYHANYNAGSAIYPNCTPSSVTPEVLAAFGIGEDQILTLTRTGNYIKDAKADEAQWKAVRSGRAYWFRGTNVIGVSYEATDRLKPVPAKNPHGVGTTSAVLIANPDAIVVFVENTTEKSEQYAMTHPAIDMVSTSYGPTGSAPLPGQLGFSFTGVYDFGKLHFGAADNTPALAPFDATAGPWWTIGIAGIEEATSNGRQAVSGNLIDFLGDFTQDLPYCTDCEKGTDSAGGTSFSTPRSAGTASKVLLEARRLAGHTDGIHFHAGQPPAMVDAGGKLITNWQLRRALEAAAWIPDVTTDYSPDIDYPIPPVAPWAVAGWGVLTTDPQRGVVPEALAQLGFGSATRVKGPDFCAFQTAMIQARKVYWDNVNTGSETFMAAPSPDPFVFCPLP